MPHRLTQLILLAALMIGCSAAASRAAFVAEYFNNYGSSGLASIEGKTAGVGWNSEWKDNTGGSVESSRTGYETIQSTFTNANYSSSGNESGADDGRGRVNPDGPESDNAGNILRRSFATSLTGTIWMSALVRHASDTDGDVLFWFKTANSGGDSDTFVGLRNGDKPTMRHGSGDNTQAADLNSAGTNLLLLAKITLNSSGSNDRIQFWVKTESDNLSSEAALGTALLDHATGDILGSDINFIGISGGNAFSNIDNLRYADGPGALSLVLNGLPVVVPAPAALPAGLGLLSMMTIRRRRRL